MQNWVKINVTADICEIQKVVIRAFLWKAELVKHKREESEKLKVINRELKKVNMKMARETSELQERFKRFDKLNAERVEAFMEECSNVLDLENKLEESQVLMSQIEQDKLSIKSLLKLDIDKIVELEEKESLLKAVLAEKDSILQESYQLLKEKQKEFDQMKSHGNEMENKLETINSDKQKLNYEIKNKRKEFVSKLKKKKSEVKLQVLTKQSRL